MLMLGLDSSGKTTIVANLKGGKSPLAVKGVMLTSHWATQQNLLRAPHPVLASPALLWRRAISK